jgi:hypothetical protein
MIDYLIRAKVAALLLEPPLVISVKMKKLAEPSGFRPYD